jgi:hypothetical protein
VPKTYDEIFKELDPAAKANLSLSVERSQNCR